MKLVLFDIDGTILKTRVGRSSMNHALARLCGRPLDLEQVAFAGKTDLQIVREILLSNGFSAPEAARLQSEVLATYVEAARDILKPHHVAILPGVRSLIERLAGEDNIQLALLTGNHEVTAYLKLEAVGLAHYFPFGAFGSDHEDRSALPPIAVRRALAHTGHAYAGKDVVIIGDSENDVRCGRGINAFSVAVCTGYTSREALAAEVPDVLLDDLCDYAHFVRQVISRTQANGLSTDATEPA